MNNRGRCPRRGKTLGPLYKILSFKTGESLLLHSYTLIYQIKAHNIAVLLWVPFDTSVERMRNNRSDSIILLRSFLTALSLSLCLSRCQFADCLLLICCSSSIFRVCEGQSAFRSSDRSPRQALHLFCSRTPLQWRDLRERTLAVFQTHTHTHT